MGSISLTDIRDVIVSSILFILSYPPSPLGFLAYFAFIPLINLAGKKTPLTMTGLSYLTGLAVNLIGLSWIIPYSFPKWMLLATLNASQFAVLGWWLSLGFLYLGNRHILFLPFFWTGFEYIRGLGDLAFNWLDISNTQTNFLYIIQMSDIGGSNLIVFWICLLNILFWFGWRSRYRIIAASGYITVIVVLLIVPLLYGYLAIQSPESGAGLRVRLFQPNTDPVIKWDPDQQQEIFSDLVSWTRAVQENDPADLLVWPETAIPFEIRNSSRDLARLNEFRVPLITGGLDFSYHYGHKHRHNAVFAFCPASDSLEVYHKLRPVPFEEVIPYQRFFPWLQQQSVYDRFLSSGQIAEPLQVRIRPVRIRKSEKWWRTEGPDLGGMQIIRIGPSICFETAFHEPAGKMVRNGADIHLVVTNDAWFGYSMQPFQHLNMAILRAVETRRSVLFCANSGFSAFIDYTGRTADRTKLFKRAAISNLVPINYSTSFYLRYGDWVALCCLLAMLYWSFLFTRGIHRRHLDQTERQKLEPNL